MWHKQQGVWIPVQLAKSVLRAACQNIILHEERQEMYCLFGSLMMIFYFGKTFLINFVMQNMKDVRVTKIANLATSTMICITSLLQLGAFCAAEKWNFLLDSEDFSLMVILWIEHNNNCGQGQIFKDKAQHLTYNDPSHARQRPLQKQRFNFGQSCSNVSLDILWQNSASFGFTISPFDDGFCTDWIYFKMANCARIELLAIMSNEVECAWIVHHRFECPLKNRKRMMSKYNILWVPVTYGVECFNCVSET
jgi:hypothetical protein